MSKSDLYFGVIVTAVGEKEQDSVYEVLFDEEFLGGLTIRSVVSETALLFAVVFTAYAEFNFVIYTWLFTRWSFSDVSVWGVASESCNYELDVKCSTTVIEK